MLATGAIHELYIITKFLVFYHSIENCLYFQLFLSLTRMLS